jgi:leukotriene-A4 hydrolase
MQVIAPKTFTVLMSGIRAKDSPELISSGERRHTFSQNVPVPSYLVAIVVAKLRTIEIGPRSRVWAEYDVVEAAAFDFSETETMIQAAEKIIGP